MDASMNLQFMVFYTATLEQILFLFQSQITIPVKLKYMFLMKATTFISKYNYTFYDVRNGEESLEQFAGILLEMKARVSKSDFALMMFKLYKDFDEEIGLTI